MPNLAFSPLSNEEIDRFLREYPEQNKREIKRLWRQCARSKDMLGYVYDRDRMVFIRNNRIVPTKTVRANVNVVSLCVADELSDIADSLIAERITLQEWHDESAERLRTLLFLTGLVALGGLHMLNRAGRQGYPAEGEIWSAVTHEAKDQLYYLRDFGRSARDNYEKLQGRIKGRIRQYALAGNTVYKNSTRWAAQFAGKTEEIRVLGRPEKHCSDCPEYAKRGWQPLGTLPRIGDSECRNYCWCHFEYR